MATYKIEQMINHFMWHEEESYDRQSRPEKEFTREEWLDHMLAYYSALDDLELAYLHSVVLPQYVEPSSAMRLTDENTRQVKSGEKKLYVGERYFSAKPPEGDERDV